MTHDELDLTRQVANMIRTAKGKETDQASDIIAIIRAAEALKRLIIERGR